MKKKDKKGEIKQDKKYPARFKTLYLEDGGDLKRIHVKQPDRPPSKLKESSKAMMEAMPHTFGDLVEGEVKKKNLTRAEKKAMRKKADVVPIGSKSLGKTGRDRNKDSPVTSEEITALEKHINKHAAAANTVNSEVVGPPKPTKLQSVTKEAQATAPPVSNKASGYSFASKKQGVINKHLYGKLIRDVGDGMTPSGLPISDFLEGGPFAPPKKEPKLQTVTKAANEDYSYEELADQNDRLKLLLHSQKADYERRLEARGEMISQMEKTIFNLRQAEHVEQFNNSHSQNYEDAVVNLQTEVACAQREVEDLKAENNLLMDSLEKLERHAASENSKPPLKTLANQFELYMVQHRDDPVRNFLRRSNYSLGMTKELKAYFDKQADHRVLLSEERKVYRKWATQSHKRLGWSVRTRNVNMDFLPSADKVRHDAYCKVWEGFKSITPRSEWEAERLREEREAKAAAIRNIGINTAVLRKPEAEDWHCAKLKVTDCNGLAERNVNMDFLPSADKVRHDAYCKVWEGFKSITPRSEWEAERLREEREAKAAAIRNTAIGKAVIPVIKACRAVNEVLNYELSKKERAELKRRQKLEKKRAKAEASRIKREREEQWERQHELERIREAQRIAY